MDTNKKCSGLLKSCSSCVYHTVSFGDAPCDRCCGYSLWTEKKCRSCKNDDTDENCDVCKDASHFVERDEPRCYTCVRRPGDYACSTCEYRIDPGKSVELNKPTGVKHDQSKPPLHLLPTEPLTEVAKVLAFGAEKYGVGNWAAGINYSRLISATLRHVTEFNAGRDTDDETKLSPIDHAIAELMFLSWMIKNRPDLDDRWQKRGAAELTDDRWQKQRETEND